MATRNAINAATGASNTMFQGQGVGVTPAFSTATWPASTTINQLLYSSSANTVGGLATANSGVLSTSSSGVPSIDTTNFQVLSTGVQMKGNNVNTAPPAGFIGEEIVGTRAFASKLAISNGVAANVLSSPIVLTAGIWDISFICGFNSNVTSVTATAFAASISTTSATLSGLPGDDRGDFCYPPTSASDFNIVVPAKRALVSANTNYYLVAFANFTAGSIFVYGRLKAVRVG